MNASMIKQKKNTVSCPYRATMDIHQIINSDAEDSRPSRELAETLLEEDIEGMEELVEEEEEEESTTQRSSTRGSQWKAWEDRAFVKEVLAVKPFNCTVQLNSPHHRKEVFLFIHYSRATHVDHQIQKRSETMEHVGSHRSEHSSKGRIDKLIYFTACESTLHQPLLYIQFAKIFTKSRFSNFHLVGYPVGLSQSSVDTLFFPCFREGFSVQFGHGDTLIPSRARGECGGNS